MKMTLTPRNELNGTKKTSFGIVLVLFIVVVLASRILYRTAQQDNPQPELSVGIATSISFNVYNESSFTLTVPDNGLYGDFERKPPGHTIPPNGSYNYQVSTNLYKTSIVNIYYNFDYWHYGRPYKGNLFVDMLAETNGVGISKTTIRAYVYGPINYYSEKENLYVRN